MAEKKLDLEECIRRFLEIRDSNPGVAIEARADLKQQIRDLNDLYWQRVDQLVSTAESAGKKLADLSEEERLCINLGFLDSRLLGEEAVVFHSKAAEETRYRSVRNIFYLTEWLEERTFSQVQVPKAAPEPAKPRAAEGEIPEAIQKLSELRLRIYHTMHRFFENLPGIPQSIVETIMSGKLDATIQKFVLAAKLSSSKLDERCVRLQEIRNKAILGARQRSKTDPEFAIFDALRRADDQLEGEWSKTQSAAPASPGAPPASTAPELEPAPQPLAAECRNVRSLIRLGTMGTGIVRTHSVLLTGEVRQTRLTLEGLSARVHEVDPHMPGDPDLLIAPYSGTGMFAWDRNTILMPLTPIKSIEESVLDAFGNYRILRDTTDGRGRLKSLWQEVFPKLDFRRDFLREYRNWVHGIGQGFRGAMESAFYEFFKKHIGPNPDELFAPTELIRLTPEERARKTVDCEGKIASSQATAPDHYALGILYARESRYSDALQQLGHAAGLDPRDARTLLTLGYLKTRLVQSEEANLALGAIAKVAPNSIWNVYATELLATL